MATRHAGVLGSPISHSLSPVLHNAAYQALGIDWDYTRHEVDVESFRSFINELDDSWAGVSLTMPLKEVAFSVSTKLSDTARLSGSINTLLFGTEVVADNTDVYGIVAALAEVDCDRALTASVIGSGATARSAIVALAQLGVQDLTVLARNPQTAQDCFDLAHSLGIDSTHSASDGKHLSRKDVVISTTPRGVADVFVADCTVKGGTLLDVAYYPWPSPLAAHWSALGGTTVSGHLMLLHQAAKQVTLMTGHAAPVEAMRTALLSALESPSK